MPRPFFVSGACLRPVADWAGSEPALFVGHPLVETMKKLVICGTLAAALFGLPSAGRCAEIVLEQSAVQSLLIEGLFKEEGKLHLQKGACYAYLEDPKVTLQNGRVIIRVHLNSRLGVPSGRDCLGVTLASWATVSAAPVAQGHVVH